MCNYLLFLVLFIPIILPSLVDIELQELRIGQ